MTVAALTKPIVTPTTKNSWPKAYFRFLKNPEERLGTKLLPLVAVGIIPVSLVEDVVLPFLAVIEFVPTSLFIIFTLFRTWQRVRLYR
jgi:hypothetical protein